MVDGAEIDMTHINQYERVFNIFDGNSEDELTQARIFWKECKNAGHEVYYWQQTDGGLWEQKS